MPALGSDNLGSRDSRPREFLRLTPKSWATFGPCLGHGSTRNDQQGHEMSRNAERSPTHRFPLSYKGIQAFDVVRMGLRG